MVTIREYVRNKLNSRVEYDNNWYNYQCVDLIKDFIRQVYWIHTYNLWNASSNYINLSSFWFSTIKYNWDNRPKRWDIISFKENSWNWWSWHVAVCLVYDEDKKQVYVLEQNGWKNSSTWTWTDAIRIQKINFSEMLGWARYNNIFLKVEQDLFDKIVHEKWIYIWEATNYLNKQDVAIKAFYFLAWYRTRLNWKNYNSIWWRWTWPTTRQELAYIILAFLNKILGKNLILDDLKDAWIWNWQNWNSQVSAEEFTFMINKTKEVFGL